MFVSNLRDTSEYVAQVGVEIERVLGLGFDSRVSCAEEFGTVRAAAKPIFHSWRGGKRPPLPFMPSLDYAEAHR